MKRLKLLTATALTTMPVAFDNTATAAPKKAERVAPALTSAAKIAMPERKSKRGSETLYPFDSLTEVGMAFGVKNKTAANLTSIVSNANRKAKVNETDGAGNTVYHTKKATDQSGNPIDVPDTSKPKQIETKKFFAFDVTAEYKKANADAFKKDGPFEGATALVFREK